VAKFCPYCGKQLGERSRFCPVCGKAPPERRKSGVLTPLETPSAMHDGLRRDNAGVAGGRPAPSSGILNDSGGNESSLGVGAPTEPATSATRNHHPETNSVIAAAASGAPANRVTQARPARAVTTRVAGGRAHLYAPPTHAFVGVFEQAGFGLRYGAWMFDFLITLIAMMSFTFLVTAVSHKSVVGSNEDLLIVAGLTLLLLLLNFVVLAGLNGQTAGMRILGIRIARVDGKPFGIKDAFLRHIIGYPLSMAIFFLGFLWMVWDPRQQGWHDKLAGTIVVMSR
jgi:uncharacterized RDD family membrane protein YckC